MYDGVCVCMWVVGYPCVWVGDWGETAWRVTCAQIDLAGMDAAETEKCVRELRLAWQLRHQHVVNTMGVVPVRV